MGNFLQDLAEGLDERMHFFMGVGVRNAENIGLLRGQQSFQSLSFYIGGNGLGKGRISRFIRDGHLLRIRLREMDDLPPRKIGYGNNPAAPGHRHPDQDIRGQSGKEGQILGIAFVLHIMDGDYLGTGYKERRRITGRPEEVHTATGNPKGQTDLFPDDAGVAVGCLQRQRMKGKFRELSKDPLEITVIFSVREKNPLNAHGGLCHGKQDFPQVGFSVPPTSPGMRKSVFTPILIAVSFSLWKQP